MIYKKEKLKFDSKSNLVTTTVQDRLYPYLVNIASAPKCYQTESYRVSTNLKLRENASDGNAAFTAELYWLVSVFYCRRSVSARAPYKLLVRVRNFVGAHFVFVTSTQAEFRVCYIVTFQEREIAPGCFELIQWIQYIM